MGSSFLHVNVYLAVLRKHPSMGDVVPCLNVLLSSDSQLFFLVQVGFSLPTLASMSLGLISMEKGKGILAYCD